MPEIFDVSLGVKGFRYCWLCCLFIAGDGTSGEDLCSTLFISNGYSRDVLIFVFLGVVVSSTLHAGDATLALLDEGGERQYRQRGGELRRHPAGAAPQERAQDGRGKVKVTVVVLVVVARFIRFLFPRVVLLAVAVLFIRVFCPLVAVLAVAVVVLVVRVFLSPRRGVDGGGGCAVRPHFSSLVLEFLSCLHYDRENSVALMTRLWLFLARLSRGVGR